MYDKITVGETIKFTSTITNLKNKAEDPTGVIFTIYDPNGNARAYIYGTDAELVRDNVGRFSIDLILSIVGTYKVRWETTSPNISIEEESIVATAKLF